jgi:diguanylate cyclase (GGDEF)-like protein/PAS domain S-box-containing protein
MSHRGSAKPVWLEPLPVAAFALCAAEFVWFGLNLSGPTGPPAIGSLPVIASTVLAPFALYRAWTAPGLTTPARRFWRMLTVAFAIVSLVTVTDIPALMRGPVTEPGPAKLAGYGIATVLTIVALYRLPSGARGRGERFRLSLDVATVTLAAVVFAWYLSFGLAADALTQEQIVASVIFCTTHSVVAFGTVRVLFSACHDVYPLALRVFAAGVASSVVGMLAMPLLADRPPVGAEPLSRCVAYALFVTAAVLQRRSASSTGAARAVRRRPFSVLPYVAVACIDVLLLATMAGDGSRAVVAVTAVTLTGLVIVRQLAAFRDNARLLDELVRQERRFRSLVQNAADAIIILDEAGVATYVSPGIERLTGIPVGNWLGRQGFAVHEDDLPVVLEMFGAVLSSPATTVHYDARIANSAKAWHWVRVALTNRLDDPAVGGIVANVSDINEARAYHEQLSHQASHDSLTDLANRTLLGDQLRDALVRSAGQRVSLALIDLDDFKAVNDTMGHPAGDELLIAVAERLRRGVRPEDLVARLGGDEFAILFADISPRTSEQLADRVLTLLGEPLSVDGRELFVQASIGIADAAPGDDVERLMRHADIAMYEAKAAGKGRIARYHGDMAPTLSARAQAAEELHHALSAGEFELYYQPIVALPDGRVTGAEALLRWHHPVRGTVPPTDFIPLAEQTGLIVPIGRWVLRDACRQAADRLAASPATAPATVSVNVSARQLREPSIVDDVLDALHGAQLPPHCLIIEITETAIVDTCVVRDAVRTLTDLGVQIALDDFGTGNSTLSLLAELPVHQLKLDRSFLRDIQHSPIAVAVIRIADAFGIPAVAEGVETSDQAEYLHDLGYPSAQGFYFGRPSPAGSATRARPAPAPA